MIQTTSSHPGLPTCLEISAETIKMPDPIIAPATIIVESNRPSPRTKFSSCFIDCFDPCDCAMKFLEDSVWSASLRLLGQDFASPAARKRNPRQGAKYRIFYE